MSPLAMSSSHPFIRSIISVVKLLAIALVALAINVPMASALVLDMKLTVAPEEQPALEKSMSEIHDFFETQPGFVRAELSAVGDGHYNLEEEWSSLKSYQDAVRQKTFEKLVKAVPGSSNWRSELMID